MKKFIYSHPKNLFMALQDLFKKKTGISTISKNQDSNERYKLKKKELEEAFKQYQDSEHGQILVKLREEIKKITDKSSQAMNILLTLEKNKGKLIKKGLESDTNLFYYINVTKKEVNVFEILDYGIPRSNEILKSISKQIKNNNLEKETKNELKSVIKDLEKTANVFNKKLAELKENILEQQKHCYNKEYNLVNENYKKQKSIYSGLLETPILNNKQKIAVFRKHSQEISESFGYGLTGGFVGSGLLAAMSFFQFKMDSASMPQLIAYVSALSMIALIGGIIGFMIEFEEKVSLVANENNRTLGQIHK